VSGTALAASNQSEGSDEQNMTTPMAQNPPSVKRNGKELSTLSPAAHENGEFSGLREQVHEIETRAAPGKSHQPDELARQRNDTCNQLLAAICQAEILAAICEAEDLKTAGAQVARELQKRVGAKRAAIGLTRYARGNVRLLALSDVDRFSPRSEVVRKFEAAMDEAVWQGEGELVAWPLGEEESQRANHAHRHLSSALNNATVVTVPLMDHKKRCWGAIVLVGVELPDSLELIREFGVSAGAPISAALGLWKRTTNWQVSHLWQAAWKAGNRRRLLAVAGFFLLGIAILGVPVPYKIECGCDVQPVSRRYVVAPFDSSLEKTLVAPGDLVTEGQILARLDGRDIRCELATIQADFNRAAKERDTALAKGNTADAQMARLEMEGLELKQKLLQQREQELEIRSPIDGILISGDWERAQGARLPIGKTLFEIGPLDRMVVEVAVAEDDIRYAQLGASVALRVNALPNQSWTGTIEKIHPRAEIREEQNVFITEVILANDKRELMPGMKGTAKVQGPTRPLGWNLFHKPWNAARRWLNL
jgi:hypothetical protein